MLYASFLVHRVQLAFSFCTHSCTTCCGHTVPCFRVHCDILIHQGPGLSSLFSGKESPSKFPHLEHLLASRFLVPHAKRERQWIGFGLLQTWNQFLEP